MAEIDEADQAREDLQKVWAELCEAHGPVFDGIAEGVSDFRSWWEDLLELQAIARASDGPLMPAELSIILETTETLEDILPVFRRAVELLPNIRAQFVSTWSLVEDVRVDEVVGEGASRRKLAKRLRRLRRDV